MSEVKERIAELEQQCDDSDRELQDSLNQLAELRDAVDNTLINGYEYLPSCGEKYLIDADDFDRLAALLQDRAE